MSGTISKTPISLPALIAANTVTTLSGTALLPLVDGNTLEYIAPADFITALGNRASDPGIPLASSLAASDRLFLDQGGASAVAVSLGTLLAYVQAALAQPSGSQPAPGAPATTAPVTQVQLATGLSGDYVRTAFPVTLPKAPKPGNTLLLLLTFGGSADHGVTAVPAIDIPGYTLLPGALLNGYTQSVAGYTRVAQAGDAAALTIPANPGFDCAATLVELSGVASVETFGVQAPAGSFTLAAKTKTTPNVLRYIYGSVGSSLTSISSATPGIELLAMNPQTYFSEALFSVTPDTAGVVSFNYTPNVGYIGYVDVLQVNVYGA